MSLLRPRSMFSVLRLELTGNDVPLQAFLLRISRYRSDSIVHQMEALGMSRL